jgi:hypothetical protein
MNTSRSEAALAAQVAELSHRLGILEDKDAIRRLHHAYGYFIDKCLYTEVVELFAERSEVRFLGGIFRGKAGVDRLYGKRFRDTFSGGRNGPARGSLLEHLVLQDVIDVAQDRRTAQARFRCFMHGGTHKSYTGKAVPQFWEAGVYENRYVKEDGVWKIQLLNYNVVFNVPYETGLANSPEGFPTPLFSVTYPQDPIGPDEINPERPMIWPETAVIPFHYPHPVTGKPVKV